MLMLFLALMIDGASAACGAPSDIGVFSAAAPRAQLAMGSLDAAGFSSAVAQARAALSCLAEPLTPLDAAGYHGLEALSAFADGQPEEAVRAFASAVATVPGFRLPSVIAPEGGDLDVLLARAKALPPSEVQALPPYDGILFVDGVRALTRPVARPCVLQLIGGDGRARSTYYLRGTDPLPSWDPPPTLLLRLLPEPRARPSVPFALAAGSTALVAGGLYALGGMAHAEFANPATPYEDLAGLQTQTNLALGGAIALGVTATVFTTLTFLQW